VICVLICYYLATAVGSEMLFSVVCVCNFGSLCVCNFVINRLHLSQDKSASVVCVCNFGSLCVCNFVKF